jgi:hypothetical protein
MYSVDASEEPPNPGTIANALPPYEGTLGAPVLIQFGLSSQRPTLTTLSNDQARLTEEQRVGVDAVRYHEILEILYANRGKG